MKSAGWNNTIAAGDKVSFGFGGAPGNITTGPQNYALNGSSVGGDPPPPPASTGVQVTITQTGAWGGGFTANLDIVNGSSQAINGWALKFQFTPVIQSLWNGFVSNQGNVYTVKNESWNGGIASGGKVTLGFTASGTLAANSGSSATLNGAACTLTIVTGDGGGGGNPGTSSIVIGNGVDSPSEALQITIPQNAATYPLSLSSGTSATFTVACNNPSVVSAQIVNNSLQLRGLRAGRAGLRLQASPNGLTRYIGVRVRTTDGQIPGFPNYLAVGSVSEDTDDHLNFWHSFDSSQKNRYVDARYIYLNGGPYYGWTTWTNTPGDRAIRYIRESKKMGMIPIFVWYNIADGGESYYTDMQHVQSASYMQDYYKLLKRLLDIIKTESPDGPVGIILEPDFLGYLAQNADAPASRIMAQTNGAYTAGVLKSGTDPQFPDTVAGLVQSINYLISRDTPQAVFGWQMNLWASPAGGWFGPIPGRGIVHLTDNTDYAQGRAAIYNEARAITQYYLDAGVKSYGAKFLSIDKYGLDAGTAEASASGDPANSTWFWNNDQWSNYLTFVRAMRDSSGLPIVLWQLPVGHVNTSQTQNPYANNSLFPDLTNSNSQGEDAAPTFFFGDTFATTGRRLSFFGTNKSGDGALASANGKITWGEHFTSAANAGVAMALFGAGVGGSTTNVGLSATDSYWWITKAQAYFQRPIPLGGN